MLRFLDCSTSTAWIAAGVLDNEWITFQVFLCSFTSLGSLVCILCHRLFSLAICSRNRCLALSMGFPTSLKLCCLRCGYMLVLQVRFIYVRLRCRFTYFKFHRILLTKIFTGIVLSIAKSIAVKWNSGLTY